MHRQYLFVGGHWHAHLRDVELVPSPPLDGVDSTPPATVLDLEHGDTYALRTIGMNLVDAAGAQHGQWAAQVYTLATLEANMFAPLVQDAAMQLLVRTFGVQLPTPATNGHQSASGLILP